MNAQKMYSSFLTIGVISCMAVGGILGRNSIEINRTHKNAIAVADQAVYLAAGEDGLLDDAERINLLKDLGLKVGLQEGNNILFREPGRHAAFSPDVLEVYEIPRCGSSHAVEFKSKYLGTVSHDVLSDYVDVHCER